MQQIFEGPSVAAALCIDARERTELLFEVSDDPPLMTVGLARALARVLVKAGRANGFPEVTSTASTEVLAS